MSNTHFQEEQWLNPSYTVKEGGILRKKIQPMAADKVKRDMLSIPT